MADDKVMYLATMDAMERAIEALTAALSCVCYVLVSWAHSRRLTASASHPAVGMRSSAAP